MATNQERFNKWKATRTCDCQRFKDIRSEYEWVKYDSVVKDGEKSTLAFHFLYTPMFCRCQVREMTDIEKEEYQAALEEERIQLEIIKKKTEEDAIIIIQELQNRKQEEEKPEKHGFISMLKRWFN